MFATKNIDARAAKRKPGSVFVIWLATGFGFGFCPIAPGTVGALWGLPLAWGIGLVPSWVVQVAIVVAICAAGVPLCTAAIGRLGRGKDPGAIVFDEIASLPITFFLVPMTSVAVVLCGFVLHRVFDVWKPPPTRRLERLPVGLGVMADDWMAGIYSNLCLQLLLTSGWLT